MPVHRMRRLTTGGCDGMDPSGALHEYGPVGLIEGRIVGRVAIGLGCTPGNVPRPGGGRTAAG
jgi:hypothetical protein